MDNSAVNAAAPLPEERSPRMVINSNSVYITHSTVVVNAPASRPPEQGGFAERLDTILHIVKNSAVKIAICVAGLIAIWAFLRFDLLHAF